MDRFVRGDEVPYEALRQVWQNTIQPHEVADLPIYEEFYRAVRAVNMSLPRDRRLRVLLGDPPLDWNGANVEQDWQKWMQERDRYPADLVRREVLAKQRSALVVYGGMHLQRKQLASNYEMADPLAHTIVSLLESTAATKVFTIWTNTHADLETFQADVASWSVPSLTIVRGTLLGATDFTSYYPFKMPQSQSAMEADFASPIPADQWRSLRMEDQFDAVLYLGPRSTITQSKLSPDRCSDAAYMKMRLGRMGLMYGPPGLPSMMPMLIDQLKKYCAVVAPK